MKGISSRNLVKVSLAFVMYFGLHISCLFAQEFEKGRLIEKVKAKADTTQSYALYLPSNYTTSKKWPILYIFDPAARGALAASKFRYAAEKYGYILVASNNSRNGDWNFVTDAMQAMENDTQQRFAVDEKRKYSSGFSGGARAAVYMAFKTGNIVGVIGCGAGFPQVVGGPISQTFDYAALVGDKDPNYYELQVLNKELAKKPGNQLLITFDGGHQWPDSTVVEKGVAWLELQAMRRGLIPVEEAFVADYVQQQKVSIAKEENPAEKYFLLNQLYKSLVGTTDVILLKEEVQRLRESAEVKKAVAKREEIEVLEGEYWERYSQALRSVFPAYAKHDSADTYNPYTSKRWWENELKSVQRKALELDEKEGGKLYERIKNYVWMSAVEDFEQAWQMERFDQAAEYLQIASVAIPESPEPYFFLTKVYSKQRKYKQAMQSLKDAADRGMSRYELITEDKLFEPLQRRKGYEDVLAQIKQNKLKKSMGQ